MEWIVGFGRRNVSWYAAVILGGCLVVAVAWLAIISGGSMEAWPMGLVALWRAFEVLGVGATIASSVLLVVATSDHRATSSLLNVVGGEKTALSSGDLGGVGGGA